MPKARGLDLSLLWIFHFLCVIAPTLSLVSCLLSAPACQIKPETPRSKFLKLKKKKPLPPHSEQYTQSLGCLTFAVPVCIPHNHIYWLLVVQTVYVAVCIFWDFHSVLTSLDWINLYDGFTILPTCKCVPLLKVNFTTKENIRFQCHFYSQ